MADYTPGTPSWVDLASPDPDASARFYGDLFGWEAEEAGPVEETGGYRMLRKDGKLVAGLGPLQGDQPPVWTTYVNVEDADETAAKATGAGGSVLAEPFDVMEAGRMGVLADPAGAVFAIWEPRRHPGAELVMEPGSFCWNELATRDPEAARAFYPELFGWEPDEQPYGDTTYTTWRIGERGVAGMMPMGDQWPPDVPSHWMVYFAVEDADATAERAEELGGNVSVPPTDIPVGRFAVLGGPAGEFFSVIRLAQQAG